MTEHTDPLTGPLPLEKLAAPARRALAAAGITQLSDLTRHTEADVGRLHGIGPNALRTLREALEARGLDFSNEGERT